MSEQFVVTYCAGGKIDDLPNPLFPNLTKPYIIGRKMDIPPVMGNYQETYITETQVEYLAIAFASSAYTTGDYWGLTIGGRTVCDTIFCKGLPESIAVGNTMVMVLPIPQGTEIIFKYNNSSNTEKKVFFNLHFLKE